MICYVYVVLYVKLEACVHSPVRPSVRLLTDVMHASPRAVWHLGAAIIVFRAIDPTWRNRCITVESSRLRMCVLPVVCFAPPMGSIPSLKKYAHFKFQIAVSVCFVAERYSDALSGLGVWVLGKLLKKVSWAKSVDGTLEQCTAD